jgi:hypothetical protein
MSRYVIGKLILAVIGIGSVWQVFNALRTMKVRGAYGIIIDRHQRPKSFWTMVAFHGLSALAFLGVILFFPN